jgi:S-adenosylmethionine/arginine decarboxylase-like enzyme
MKTWGQHLILDAHRCRGLAIRSQPHIIAFSKKLVKAIDMVPYGEPWCERFGDGNKAGYTLVQLIMTSNIVAHFAEETNDMYLDVFSCKEFDPAVVEQVVYDHFYPLTTKTTLVERQAQMR